MDYDNNPIQVYTAYTYEEMKAFQKFAMRHSKVPFTVLFIAWIIILFLYVIGTVRNQTAFSFSMLIPTIFFTMMFFLVHGLFYTQRANDINSRHIKNGETFFFRNSDFSILAEQADYRCAVDMRYDFLYSFHETRDMFYLFINPRLAYLVSKRGFQNRNPEELRALLNSYVIKHDVKLAHKGLKIYFIILLFIVILSVLIFSFMINGR